MTRSSANHVQIDPADLAARREAVGLSVEEADLCGGLEPAEWRRLERATEQPRRIHPDLATRIDQALEHAGRINGRRIQRADHSGRCQARKRNGRPCNNYPRPGTLLCRVHSPDRHPPSEPAPSPKPEPEPNPEQPDLQDALVTLRAAVAEQDRRIEALASRQAAIAADVSGSLDEMTRRVEEHSAALLDLGRLQHRVDLLAGELTRQTLMTHRVHPAWSMLEEAVRVLGPGEMPRLVDGMIRLAEVTADAGVEP